MANLKDTVYTNAKTTIKLKEDTDRILSYARSAMGLADFLEEGVHYIKAFIDREFDELVFVDFDNVVHRFPLHTLNPIIKSTKTGWDAYDVRDETELIYSYRNDNTSIIGNGTVEDPTRLKYNTARLKVTDIGLTPVNNTKYTINNAYWSSGKLVISTEPEISGNDTIKIFNVKTNDEINSVSITGSGATRTIIFNNNHLNGVDQVLVYISETVEGSLERTSNVVILDTPNAYTYTAGDHISVNNRVISATYSNATTSNAGLMSSSDKSKLNGIASGAEVNVQSDWNETDSSKDSYIKNKPAIQEYVILEEFKQGDNYILTLNKPLEEGYRIKCYEYNGGEEYTKDIIGNNPYIVQIAGVSQDPRFSIVQDQ